MKYFVMTMFLLTGCAGQPLTQSEINEINTPVTCKDKAECDSKWQHAQLWIVNNSYWKIQTATDVVIQTFGPGDETTLAYTVTKENNTDGSGQINIKAYCGNWVGCIPRPGDAILQFKHYMN